MRLLSNDENTRSNFIIDTKASYERIRQQRGNRKSNKQYISLNDARANKWSTDWPSYQAPMPNKTGVTVLDSISLETLVECIDWTPFFTSWQLTGKFPAILSDEIVGNEARKLFEDAQNMLKRINC